MPVVRAVRNHPGQDFSPQDGGGVGPGGPGERGDDDGATRGGGEERGERVHEGPRRRDVLNHFRRYHRVERPPRRHQLFCGADAVTHPGRYPGVTGRVRPCGRHAAGRRIYARHSRTQAGQGFRQQAAPAADVHDGQASQRFEGGVVEAGELGFRVLGQVGAGGRQRAHRRPAPPSNKPPSSPPLL